MKLFEKVIITSLLVSVAYVVLSPMSHIIASDHSGHAIDTNIQWATVVDDIKTMLKIAVTLIASSILITSYYVSKISGEQHKKMIKVERMILLILLTIFVFVDSNINEVPYKLLIVIVWNIVSWFNNDSVMLKSIKCISSKSLLSLLYLEQITEYTAYGITYPILSITSKYAVIIWLSILISQYVILFKNKISNEQLFQASIRTLSKLANVYILFVFIACFIQTSIFRASIDRIYINMSYIYLLITICLYIILKIGVKNYFHNYTSYQLQQHLRLVINISIVSLLFIIMIPLSTNAKSAMLKEAVYWHVMGEDSHMSLRMGQVIKKSNMQSVQLDLWLPSQIEEPASVDLTFKFADTSIDIPLQLEASGPDPYGFEGFDKYTYKAVGNFVTEEGQIYAIIIATDQTGKVYSYEKEIVQ